MREFKFIRWLSFGRAAVLSLVVLTVAFIAGFGLGALDNAFAQILKTLVL